MVLPPAGGTLSQLSDSGQTLSEDSGVDIAEVGVLVKDGSPRPSKSQHSKAEHVAPLKPVRAHASLACVHTLAWPASTC